MKFLAFITNLLLGSVLGLTITLAILDHTASASYLSSVAERTNTYQSLSEFLPSQLTGGGNTGTSPTEPQMLAVLKSALTPDYVRQLLTSALTQFEAMFKHGAPQVTIDISAIAAQARAAGIPADEANVEPIVVSATKLEKPIAVVHWIGLAEIAGTILSVILLISSVYLGYQRRSYRGLGWQSVGVAVSLGITAAALFGLPERLVSHVVLNATLAPIAPLVQAIVGVVGKDLAKQFGMVAVVTLVVGLMLILLDKFLPHKPAVVLPSTQPRGPGMSPAETL